MLRNGYLVILNKHNLNLAVNRRIVVDNVRHAVNQLNGQLGNLIACGSLSAKNKCPWVELHIRMRLELVIQVHHMEDVQQLALVLMQALHLHVKNGARVYFNAVVLTDILCQAQLILIFDVHELLLCLLILRIDRQLL